MQIQMNVNSQQMIQNVKPAADRPNPGRFVTSVAITLFALTMVSVLTMHMATAFGWQLP